MQWVMGFDYPASVVEEWYRILAPSSWIHGSHQAEFKCVGLRLLQSYEDELMITGALKKHLE